jgi:hypothetical protein
MAAPLGDADKRIRRSLKRKLASATRRPSGSLPWNATVTSCSAPSSRRFAQGTAASMAATELLLHSSENAFAAGLVEGVEKKGWGHENGEQTRE